MNSSSFPAAPALTPGYKLDRYELLCPLAQGGMASVWLARLQGKHGFEKLVAIKTILPNFAADSRFRQMFLDEARIASRIEHANVAQILDLGEQHDLLYLVMEWIEGDSLSKLCRAVEKDGKRLPLGIVLRILADACAGLHAAHELCDAAGHPLGVVHRDVSPQNILVNTKGVVKIIDFGVAKARDRHAEETSAGMLKGKILYMAPEQAMGKLVDRRADLWAIGAILHRLLSGRAPFEAENQLATLHLLSSGQALPELPVHVPRQISAIVRRALTHEVGGRFATAAELGATLEAAMQSTRNVAQASDVAAYMEEQLAQRSLARKEAVALALKAAEERTRIAKVFETNTEVASGVGKREEAFRDDTMTLAPGPTSVETQTAAPNTGEVRLPTRPSGNHDESSIGTLATASSDILGGSRRSRTSKRTLSISLVAASVVVSGLFLWSRLSTVAQTASTQPPAASAPDPLSLPPPPAETPAIVVDERARQPLPAPVPAPSSTPPRRSPRPIVSRPRTEAPVPTAPKKRKIDDGF